MAGLMFYRQKRVDGGIRMGIDLDGVTAFDHFEPGSPDRDPALLWFVDLRCEGRGVPSEPEEGIQWLLEQSELIREGFSTYADLLSAGGDADEYPMKWSGFPRHPADTQMSIAWSAMRRVDAREIGIVLRDIGDHWLDYIRELESAQPVT